VCKAPGAALAPPNFQSHLAFTLPMLSTGSGFIKPTREISARGPERMLQLVLLLFFPEATRAANHTSKCARSNGTTTPPP
jgi:hypothetical protein